MRPARIPICGLTPFLHHPVSGLAGRRFNAREQRFDDRVSEEGVGGARKWLSMAPEKNKHFGLVLNEAAVAFFGQASLIMRNLRTNGREDVGGGYTNQTAEGQRA